MVAWYSTIFSEAGLQVLLERMGWALLHSVWQIAIIWCVLWGVLRLIPARSSSPRYLVSCGALFSMMLCGMVTFALVGVEASREPELLVAETSDVDSEVVSRGSERGTESSERVSLPLGEGSSFPDPQPKPEAKSLSFLASWVEPWLATVVGVWAVGVLIASIRPLISWYFVCKLRRVGTSEVSSQTVEALHRLSERMGLKGTIEISYSRLVEVPAVIGYFRPLILLPVAAVNGLTAQQLEALLAHELAHISRHDYLFNLLQNVIETLLFYHPAVWWVSSHIRRERENCCDDLAVRLCSDRLVYAEALLAIENLRANVNLAMSSSGGSLLQRIQRLVSSPQSKQETSGWWMASALSIASVVLIVLTVWSSQSGLTAAENNVPEWGTPVNGLQIRAVPVSVGMSEDDVDMTKVIRKVKSQDQLAFAVELKNASAKPLQFIDARYGDGYGSSKGKANSNWSSQFLFTIDYYDSKGNLIGRPEVEVVDLDSPLGGSLVVDLQPGETHQILIRPTKWLSVMQQRIGAGKFTAVVHYHGLPKRVDTRIREYRANSVTLSAWGGDAVTPSIPFEVVGERTGPNLKWGDTNGALRAALEFVPNQKAIAHGVKPDTKLHIQNVSGKPVTLSSHLWLSQAPLTAFDSKGAEASIQAAWYSGWVLTGRVTLAPRDVVVFDAGNLGIAKNDKQRDGFAHVTNRKIVTAAGDYEFEMAVDFRKSAILSDGKGKQLAPLQGDWAGGLKTGRTPLTISAADERGPASELTHGRGVADESDDKKNSGAKAGKENDSEPLTRIVSQPKKRVSLHDALNDVCAQAKVKLELDSQALKRNGLTQNMRIQTVFSKVKLESALKKILANTQPLEFALDKNTVFISSKERVAARKRLIAERNANSNDSESSADKNQGDKNKDGENKEGENKDGEEHSDIGAKDEGDRQANASGDRNKVGRVIEGHVWGPGGNVSGAKVDVEFSLSDRENPVATDLLKGVVVERMSFTTDENGKYRIRVPEKLANTPDIRIEATISKTGLLTRTIGAIPLTDFDKASFENDEPYWLHRQLARGSFLSCGLKKARRLEGRVRLPNGKPAVGATVEVNSKYAPYSWKFHDPNAYGANESVVTDQAGEFTAYHESWATVSVRLAGQATLLIDNLEKYLKSSSPNQVVEFAMPVPHVATGRVVDHKGNPVAGAIVEARRLAAWNEFDMPLALYYSVATDRNGTYRLPVLPSDNYTFHVQRQLKDPALIEKYNSREKSDVDLPMRSVTGVYLKREVKIDRLPVQRVDFSPVDTAEVSVNVKFPPSGRPRDGRVYDLTIQGKYQGKAWSGTAVRASREGTAKLYVPIGAEDVYIGTGLARHRRGPQEPIGFGTVLHLGTINGDVSGLEVIEEKLAELNVRLKLSPDLARNEVNLRINAYHAEPGVRRQPADPQKLWLVNAIKTGKTRYRGSALPNTEIVLNVTQWGKGLQDKLLFEQRFTFEPGENRVVVVDLTK